MFLGGLWCSAKKPPTATVLKPTITELHELENEGIRFCIYVRTYNLRLSECHAGIKVTTVTYGEVICRVKLLVIIADLPAKAALLNCIQYNGVQGWF